MKNVQTTVDKLTNRLPWLLVVGGGVGVLASLMLSIEEFHFIKNPKAPLACDINPIIGCGSAMNTWQGHVLLGIPNQFFGLIAFSVIATLGVILLTKTALPRWIWQGLVAGLGGAILFISWFIFQSIYVLEHLCPYCMATWTVTIPMAWYVFLYSLRAGYLNKLRIPVKIRNFLFSHHLDILLVWFLVIAALILQHFWYYFAG